MTLTRAEALVLFEWLHRNEATDVEHPTLGVDEAELRVLWDMSASLERVLTEPFARDYVSLVAKARSEVLGGE